MRRLTVLFDLCLTEEMRELISDRFSYKALPDNAITEFCEYVIESKIESLYKEKGLEPPDEIIANKGLYYISSKGNKVYVNITQHAINRFLIRHRLVFGKPTENPINDIRQLFNNGSRLSLRKRKVLRDRAKKYKGDSLYIKNGSFVFVVENAQIVTVEIGDDGQRYLNKRG